MLAQCTAWPKYECDDCARPKMATPASRAHPCLSRAFPRGAGMAREFNPVNRVPTRGAGKGGRILRVCPNETVGPVEEAFGEPPGRAHISVIGIILAGRGASWWDMNPVVCFHRCKVGACWVPRGGSDCLAGLARP